MRLLLLLFFAYLPFIVTAENGYRIEVQLNGFEGDTLFMAYYMGQHQYLSDTTVRMGNTFIFEGDTLLEPGVYMLVMPPSNDIIQILMDPEDQEFRIDADISNGRTDISFEGSRENELYYEYIDFIKARRPVADSLRAIMDTLEQGDSLRTLYDDHLIRMDNEVDEFTNGFIEKHDNSIAAMLLLANKQIDVPEARDDSKEEQLRRFNYFKEHYFDYLDLDNPAALRTPFLYNKVSYFIDKMTYKHPDSISNSMDLILGKMEGAPETYRYYLSTYLNKYAKSKIVGMDGVYVHLVDNYYAAGKAPWMEKDQLKKIIRNANSLRPTLIGRLSPDLKLQDREGTIRHLHSFDSDFTVLYFWRPDCGHCKKSTPKLIDFYKEYKAKGVEVVAVCSKFNDDVPKCWDYIDDLEGMNVLHNLVDPHHQSRFQTLYYIKTTPRVFVIDKDKKIISKGIGVEQLKEVLDHYIKLKEEKVIQEGK